jgi:hypothetical protein
MLSRLMISLGVPIRSASHSREILMNLGPIAQIIGYSFFGISVLVVGTYRVPIGSAITGALVSYVLMLAGTYVLALIIDNLAPIFNGQRRR